MLAAMKILTCLGRGGGGGVFALGLIPSTLVTAETGVYLGFLSVLHPSVVASQPKSGKQVYNYAMVD